MALHLHPNYLTSKQMINGIVQCRTCWLCTQQSVCCITAAVANVYPTGQKGKQLLQNLFLYCLVAYIPTC